MQNRRGPEPAYCTVFVADKPWVKLVNRRGISGCKLYPKTVVDHGIVTLYHSARMPQTEPAPPFDAETKVRIESLYEVVRTHFNE